MFYLSPIGNGPSSKNQIRVTFENLYISIVTISVIMKRAEQLHK